METEPPTQGEGARREPPGEAPAAPRPLDRRRIILTRSEEKAEDLSMVLQRMGAAAIVLPLLRHVGVEDPAWERLGRYSRLRCTHLAFTSQTAVRFFADAAPRHGFPLSAWAGVRVAAVGAATARVLAELGLPPWLVATGGGAALARKLLEEGLGPADRVLFPSSAVARREFEESLEAAGVPVERLIVYDTIPEEEEKTRPVLKEVLREPHPDAILFASPSAVEAFVALAGPQGRAMLSSGLTRVVSLGPTTSRAILSLGLTVAAEAEAPTSAALARATVLAIEGAAG